MVNGKLVNENAAGWPSVGFARCLDFRSSRSRFPGFAFILSRPEPACRRENRWLIYGMATIGLLKIVFRKNWSWKWQRSYESPDRFHIGKFLAHGKLVDWILQNLQPG